MTTKALFGRTVILSISLKTASLLYIFLATPHSFSLNFFCSDKSAIVLLISPISRRKSSFVFDNAFIRSLSSVILSLIGSTLLFSSSLSNAASSYKSSSLSLRAFASSNSDCADIIRYAPVFSLISAVFRQMLVIKERRCFLLYACPDEKEAVSCSAPSILYLNTMHC